MSVLTVLSSHGLPPLLRRATLRRLTCATAVALKCAPPSLAGLSPADMLARYASFTAQQVQAAIRDGQDLVALQARLYKHAFALGRWCRRMVGVRTTAQAMVVERILYRCLEIDFRGDAQGEVVIEGCFFRRWYTPDICRIMSAMDSGILAGLLGGGELVFHARITEGAPHCWARFGVPSGRR